MGHVVRSTDPTDRRATVVELTDSGREAIDRNRKIVDTVLKDAWEEHVDDTEAKVVADVMERVLEAHHFNHH